MIYWHTWWRFVDDLIGDGAGDDAAPLFGGIDGAEGCRDCGCGVGWVGDRFFGCCCNY